LNASFWSKLAETYDDWFKQGDGPTVYREETSVLLRLAEELKPGRLLDVGCGTGLFSQIFSRLGWDVVGLDYSLGMVLKAKGKGLTVILADAGKLPFKPEAFDCALMFTVLEFLREPLTVLEEISRVVKPYGSLILGVHNFWSSWNLYRKLQAKFKASSAYKHAKYYTLKELKKMLEEASFMLEEAFNVLFHPKTVRMEHFLGFPGFGRFGALLVVRAVKRG
jgi:SAM-dependent methyltransferase